MPRPQKVAAVRITGTVQCRGGDNLATSCHPDRNTAAKALLDFAIRSGGSRFSLIPRKTCGEKNLLTRDAA